MIHAARHPIAYAKAECLSALSSGAQKVPLLAEPFLGWSDDNVVQTRWRHARSQESDDDFCQFVEYEGNPDSGSVAAQYGRVAMLSVSCAEMDRKVAEYGGEHAVAYEFKGSQVMVGTAQRGELFSVHPDHRDRYAVCMGIGIELARLSLGVWSQLGFYVSVLDEASAGPTFERDEAPVTIA